MPLNGMHLPSTKKPTPTGVKLSSIGEAELIRERDHPLVGGHDHVVEAVDAMAGEVHRAGQPARRGGALEQRDARAGLREAQREDGAEDAGADDADRATAARESRGSARRGISSPSAGDGAQRARDAPSAA